MVQFLMEIAVCTLLVTEQKSIAFACDTMLLRFPLLPRHVSVDRKGEMLV